MRRTKVGFWDGWGGVIRWGPRAAFRSARGRNGRFLALLAGARAMDEHCRTAPVRTESRCCSRCSASGTKPARRQATRCCLRPVHGVFPELLQPLDMESNGKRVLARAAPRRGRRDDVWVSRPNGQHDSSVLHRAPRSSVRLIGFLENAHPRGDQHSSCWRPVRADRSARVGRTARRSPPKGATRWWRIALPATPGNKLVAPVEPATFGALIAMTNQGFARRRLDGTR